MVPSGIFQGECLWCQEHVPHRNPLNIPEAALIEKNHKSPGNETGGRVKIREVYQEEVYKRNL